MESSAIRRLLESLCSNSPWSYAVFWKLQQLQNDMFLTFEDGYCDYQKRQPTSHSILGDKYSTLENAIKFGSEIEIGGVNFMQHPNRYAVDDMSGRQYLLGEGLVGGVAQTGNNIWIYSDDIESFDFPSNIEGNTGEVLLPVTAGIKTTLMTPILPHGVLQLGSFGKVAENMEEVAHINGTVNALMCMIVNELSSCDGDSLVCSPILIPERETIDVESLYLRDQSEDSKEIYTVEFIDNELLTADEFMVPFTIRSCLELEDITTISQFTCDQDLTCPQFDLSMESETVENLWTYSCQGEEYFDTVFSVDASSDYRRGYTKLQGVEGLSRDYDQPTIQENNDTHPACSYEANVYSGGVFNPSETHSYGWFDEGDDIENHLEAAVATLYDILDDSIYNRSDSCISSITSLVEIASPFQKQNSDEHSTSLLKYDTMPVNGICAKLSGHQSTFGESLTSPSSFESLQSAYIDNEQPMESDYGLTFKNSKTPTLSKGKVRLQSKLRPRPRDRQLVQDRLKELRKLVPNSTKCSIDGLLDQTAKHMMFLKVLTEQAQKVKYFTHEELVADKNGMSQPSSTSLIEEEGDNVPSCPIIVKDMGHPRQFLLQILCSSDEVFFEMIGVLHQLKLTILQGVMGSHCNKWARFVVEASDGFNRLDIFWPMMRILQRNGN